MRKLPYLMVLAVCCVGVAHGKEWDAVRCTGGSPRWEGKAGKFKMVLDGNDAPGECQLSLSRGNKEAFATHAKIIDILVRSTDVNMDTKPELAFQTGPSGACCWVLHLLALEDSPVLVGEMQNQLPFSYRGEGIYGAPEFLAQEGSLATGFDGLADAELTDLPKLVIQWYGAEAADITPNYARDYDQVSARLRLQLTPERIAAFRQSDGKLQGSGVETQHLRKTKAQVLAVVLTDLFTGYDGSAWSKLEELWPASDVPRIRALLEEALKTGLRSRLVQPPLIANPKCHTVAGEPLFKVGAGKVTAPRIVDSRDPEYSDEAREQKLQGTVVLAAVISATGCVRELKLIRHLGLGLDEKAIEAVLNWKFQPAKQNGVPVAVQINIEVSFRLGY